MSLDDIRRAHVVKFTNVRIVRNGRLADGDCETLWVAGGRIIDPEARFWIAMGAKMFAADIVVDCGGLICGPGLIDLQINGGFGVVICAYDTLPPACMISHSRVTNQHAGLYLSHRRDRRRRRRRPRGGQHISWPAAPSRG